MIKVPGVGWENERRKDGWERCEGWEGWTGETYGGGQEGEERGVVTPSDTVVQPLAMMIASINAVVAL